VSGAVAIGDVAAGAVEDAVGATVVLVGSGTVVGGGAVVEVVGAPVDVEVGGAVVAGALLVVVVVVVDVVVDVGEAGVGVVDGAAMVDGGEVGATTHGVANATGR
jgi:hypothetical protein